MAYTPYQLSGSQTNLLELLQESDLKKQKFIFANAKPSLRQTK